MFLCLKCKKRWNAFALISVLILVSILSLIALEFSSRSVISLKLSINYALSKKAYFYAYGGYQTAVKILMMDKNDYDGPGDYWYGLLPPIPLEDGSLMVTIEDEKARFNIRKLVTSYGKEDERRKVMLTRIFDALDIDDTLIDGIIDWQDSDDIPLPYGAEAMYYNNQSPPCAPRNAPVLTSGELLLIKGFDRKLYFLPPSSRSPFAPEELEAMSHYITVYGDGKININTADVHVLLCLSRDMDAAIAEDIVEYRKEQAFTTLEDLKNIETISDILYDEVASLITVKSDTFRITSTGISGDFIRTITVVVQRDSKEGVRVVYFNRSL